MPIKKENQKRYPKDWKLISMRIRFERAENRCECAGDCGTDHSSEPFNVQYGRYPSARCTAFNYFEHPITGSKVVLTVAHLDHAPENCDLKNLKAMCQRCHLRYDSKMHAVNRKRGLRCKKTPDLLEINPTREDHNA